MKTFQQFMEEAAPNSQFYRNYLNDMIPGSAGNRQTGRQQMPLMPPGLKQDALQQWMKSRGFPGAKAPVKTKKPLVA